jgi:hypothetical protein
LQHDSLKVSGVSASSDSSKDEDWDDTDEGTAEGELFFQEFRFLSISFVSCAFPLLLSAASAAAETLTATWLGPRELLIYAGVTLLQAPVTSIIGAMVDACGMLSNDPHCPAFLFHVTLLVQAPRRWDRRSSCYGFKWQFFGLLWC